MFLEWIVFVHIWITEAEIFCRKILVLPKSIDWSPSLTLITVVLVITHAIFQKQWPISSPSKEQKIDFVKYDLVLGPGYQVSCEK